MALAEIVGHARQRKVLVESLTRGALAPAYLFHGPPGVGKMTTALEFARAILCLEGGSDACGRCDSCRRAGGEAHGDLMVEAPEKRILKIEQVRRVQDFLSLTPSLGTRKVAVFDAADSMNTESANALLKTLEEPPPGTVIILVSSNPGALAPTVLSRCRRVGFGSLEDGQVAEVLQRQGWSTGEASAGAALADGSPSAALALEGESWGRARTQLEAFLGAAAKGDKGGVLGLVEGFAGQREDAELVLLQLLAAVRQELRARVGLRADGRDAASASLKELGRERLEHLAGLLVETLGLLAGNVNVKLALGAFFTDWIDSPGSYGKG